MISIGRSLFRSLICRRRILSPGRIIFYSMRPPTANIYITEIMDMYSTQSLTMQELLVTRHPSPNAALYYEDDNLQTNVLSYGQLDELSSKFAAVLSSIGVSKGSSVGVMLPKGPHIVIAALATWRLGAVYVPLFTAFGPEAIGIRLKDANANIVITDQANRSKFNGLVEELCLKMVSVSEDNSCLPHGDIAFSLDSLVRSNAYVAPPVQISCSDDIILLYTSGTTGLPKAVSIPAVALASFHVYMQLGLGLSCGDIDSSVSSCPLPPCASSSLTTSSRYQRYLSTADPAWAYGLYYNLVGPLLIGIPATYLTGPFASSHVVRSLQNFKITHFASSPSAYRAIKADDVSGALGASDEDWRDIAETLQCSSSAGEPLNPEIIRWWQGRMSGKLIADHYGQSEAGMMVNWHWVDSPTCSTIGKNLRLMSSGKEKSWIQVGSMGRSMPGFRLVVLNDEDQEVAEECGQLAVDLYHSPLMWFKGYRNDSERTQRAHSHTGRYYLTGDVVHMEELAEIPTFWYSSRGDDVITSSGYRIGPFDVENCLMGDSRVTEVAVVGLPDPEGLRGEIVGAFIVLNTSALKSQSEDELKHLCEELKQHVKSSLSKHCYPRVIRFVKSLPKTPSGKLQRFKIKYDYLASDDCT